MTPRSALRAPAGLALALAVLAISLRALVPAGYMPSGGAQGPMLVICTSEGAKVVSGHDPGVPQDGSQAAHGEHCVFAGGAVVAPPVVLATAVAAFAPAESLAPAIPRDVVPGRGLAAPPPPATGPPSLST